MVADSGLREQLRAMATCTACATFARTSQDRLKDTGRILIRCGIANGASTTPIFFGTARNWEELSCCSRRHHNGSHALTLTHISTNYRVENRGELRQGNLRCKLLPGRCSVTQRLNGSQLITRVNRASSTCNVNLWSNCGHVGLRVAMLTARRQFEFDARACSCSKGICVSATLPFFVLHGAPLKLR